jgi:hypothetical protein
VIPQFSRALATAVSGPFLSASKQRLRVRNAYRAVARGTRRLWYLVVENPLRFRTLMIVKLLPRDKWYSAALSFSRFEAFVERLIRKKDRRGTAYRLRSWIKDLTTFGAFPIPLRVIGMDIIKASRQNGRGLLLCSSHIPLHEMFLLALVNAGFSVDIIVAGAQNLLDTGRFQILGAIGSMPAVPAGSTALLHLRTKLRSGGLAISLLDSEIGGPLSGNLLRLAGKVSATVVFWSVSLTPDFIIEIRVESPPYPECDTEEAIRQNLAFAEDQRAPYI